MVTQNDTCASRSRRLVPSLAKWTKIKISQYHWTLCINHKSFGWYNLWKKNNLSFKCGTIIQWSLRMTHASRSGKLVPSLAKWTKIKISQYHWTIIMYRCKTRVFYCKNFKRKIICHLKCSIILNNKVVTTASSSAVPWKVQ